MIWANLRKAIISASVLTLASCAATHSAADETIGTIQKLASATTDISEEEYASIADLTNDVGIVGLGETNHGSSDITMAKLQMIKSLVERGGFQLIVLEASLGEVTYLNDYVMGERDDLDALLNNISLWMFQTEEFKSFMIWLREHNEQAEKDVQLVGMEMQYIDRSLGWLRDYTKAIKPVESAKIFEQLGEKKIASGMITAKEFYSLWQPMGDDALLQHLDAMISLKKLLEDHSEVFIEQTSQAEYDEASRHLKAMSQFTSAMVQFEVGARHQMRDYYMFLNLIHARYNFGNPKTVVWAHNEHIWKREGNGGYDVLGRQLAKLYGDHYFSIGIDFGAGSFIAPDKETWFHTLDTENENALSELLSLDSDAFVCLRCVGDKLAENKAYIVRPSAGGYVTREPDGALKEWAELSLHDRYDAILYLKKIERSTLLGQ